MSLVRVASSFLLLLLLLSIIGVAPAFTFVDGPQGVVSEVFSIIADCWGIPRGRAGVEDTSCGTTKVEWEKSPIATGSKADIGTPASISQRQVSAMEPSSC